MLMGYNAKKDLYELVDRVRRNAGISIGTPIRVLSLCQTLRDVSVVFHEFDTQGFCGAAFAGPKENTIVLNNTRSRIEQNFDCGHELIHLLKHRGLNGGIFQCFSTQNSFLEWEANEGSAQLIVPYQDFIPRFVSCLQSNYPVWGIQEELAEFYGVSSQVIRIRLNSLSYEIDQYRRGVPLEGLELLSRSKQQKRGIHPTCYDALLDFPLDWCSTIG